MTKILKDELDAFIITTNQKALKIKHIDKLINAMPDSRAKKIYTGEMLELIEEYHVEVGILEVLLTDYIEQVKKDTGEIPLTYYKLAKGLRES